MLNVELNFRFPTLGLLMPLMHDADYWPDITGGIGIGVGIKYFKPSPIGGLYVGPFAEFGSYEATYDDGYTDVSLNVFGGNVGYRFVFSSGLYLRTGGYFGLAFSENKWNPDYGSGDTNKYTTVFFLADVALGFSF